MPRMDVTEMPFAKLYPLLVVKAEKKGRTREEVDQVTAWLTGYPPEELARLEQSDASYGDFFRNAPAMNPNRTLITGKICGVRVEEKEKYGWEFLFLGANIDAVETAGHLGIAPDRVVNYHCDSEGTRLNYEVVGQAVAAVRCSAPLDEHWKDAIEEDFRKRQKKGRK